MLASRGTGAEDLGQVGSRSRPIRDEPGQVGDEPGQVGDLTVAAALFHSLSDPARLTILQHLSLGEHRVRDLTEHLGLAQSTVSAHLACLKGCGLVTCRAQGRASLFSLTAEPDLRAVLAAAEHLLGATGYAVSLCPVTQETT